MPWRPHLDHQVHKALVVIARHRGIGPNDQVAIDPSREVDMLACKTGNGHLRSGTIPLGAYLPRAYTCLTFKPWPSLGSHCSLPHHEGLLLHLSMGLYTHAGATVEDTGPFCTARYCPPTPTLDSREERGWANSPIGRPRMCWGEGRANRKRRVS